MNGQSERTIIGSMTSRTMGDWKGKRGKTKYRPSRRFVYVGAIILCLCAGTYGLVYGKEDREHLASVMTTGFEYDETLGRLQYVSSILPESAMVFLSESDQNTIDIASPCSGMIDHAWSQSEPWLEYDQAGDVFACNDGEVMTVIKNRENKYTVRLRHKGEYESVYSGLTKVFVEAYDSVAAKERIGNTDGIAAFELRRDGLSILPVFTEVGDVK